jgi:15-cis-phytoene synthase
MTLSTLGELVRRHDPDRFLCALFAPAERRETLFLLYAFNHELARAREVASQPTLALIRLQWWREVVEGARRRHEIAGPLGEALDTGRLQPADLAAMIEGREAEADAAIPTLAAWEQYVGATAGGVAVAAGRALGADEPTLRRLRPLGTAYGIAGQLRSVPALTRQGRCQLPEEVLAAHGLTVHDVVADPRSARLAPALRALADHGRRLLSEARGPVPRGVAAAALPAVLARRDLARLGQAIRPRGISDRLAVVVAGLTARV